MINQRHSIEKASLQLGFASEKSAKRWQEEYLQTFRDQALPALEKVLDSYARDGQTIRLERLQIDLGAIPPDSSGRVFIEKLKSRLAEQLAGLLSGDAAIAANGVEVRSAAASAMEALKYFLLGGQLPLSASFGFREATERLWREKPNDFIAMLKRAFRQGGETVAHRLACQFEQNLLMELLDKLQPGPFSTVVRAFRQKIKALSPSTGRMLEEPFWIAAMEVGLRQEPLPGGMESAFYGAFRKQTLLSGFGQEVLEGLLPEEFLAVESPDQLSSSSFEPSVQKDPSSIFGANAGIILLHPFLGSYFQEFGLLQPGGKEFKGRKAQMKAAYLLHFLATGEWLCPEPQLSIQKVICGLPLYYPISRQFSITIAEREESEKLLQAVLKHWPALGNTSPDGLREGFLQRAGKLQQQEGGWLLRIEKKTIDLLLDKLPWNISLIKLPWLKELIRVEWA